MKISAILPAYNEEKTISDVIKVVKAFREREKLDLEIIVVSDGSVDRTAEYARKAGANLVIELKKNLGKGEAVLAGFKKAKGKVILLLDTDLINLKVEHLQKMLHSFLNENPGMVVGLMEKKFFDRIFSGQRIVKREILYQLGKQFKTGKFKFKKIGFKLEPLLDLINDQLGYKVSFVNLEGLNHLKKEKKYNFRTGISKKFDMFIDIFHYVFSQKRFILKFLNYSYFYFVEKFINKG
jgi:glycosyltransferase involved in cell wall biosynthesis